MLTLSATLEPHAETIFTALDNGEGVLLHLATRKTYTLNETGTFIWEGISRGQSLQGVSAQLQAEFAVDGTQADKSVLLLANDFLANDLVTLVTETS